MISLNNIIIRQERAIHDTTRPCDLALSNSSQSMIMQLPQPHDSLSGLNAGAILLENIVVHPKDQI